MSETDVWHERSRGMEPRDPRPRHDTFKTETRLKHSKTARDRLDVQDQGYNSHSQSFRK